MPLFVHGDSPIGPAAGGLLSPPIQSDQSPRPVAQISSAAGRSRDPPPSGRRDGRRFVNPPAALRAAASNSFFKRLTATTRTTTRQATCCAKSSRISRLWSSSRARARKRTPATVVRPSAFASSRSHDKWPTLWAPSQLLNPAGSARVSSPRRRRRARQSGLELRGAPRRRDGRHHHYSSVNYVSAARQLLLDGDLDLNADRAAEQMSARFVNGPQVAHEQSRDCRAGAAGQ